MCHQKGQCYVPFLVTAELPNKMATWKLMDALLKWKGTVPAHE
jgi:hypothetical protein